MKKDLPMPVVIAVLVIVILLVIGVYWGISAAQNNKKASGPATGTMPPPGMPMPGQGMPNGQMPNGARGPQGPAPQGIPTPPTVPQH